MLLRCCLKHITTIAIRYILYLVHLCIYIFRPRSIYVVSKWSMFHFQLNFYFHQSYNLIKTLYLEYILLFLHDNVGDNAVSGCCLAFAWFFANFSLVLLIKVLLIKKVCIPPWNQQISKGIEDLRKLFYLWCLSGFWIRLLKQTYFRDLRLMTSVSLKPVCFFKKTHFFTKHPRWLHIYFTRAWRR